MAKPNTTDIPQDWIKMYVDTLIKLAKELPPDSIMREATLTRAEHVMDLVEAYRAK